MTPADRFLHSLYVFSLHLALVGVISMDTLLSLSFYEAWSQTVRETRVYAHLWRGSIDAGPPSVAGALRQRAIKAGEVRQKSRIGLRQRWIRLEKKWDKAMGQPRAPRP